MSITYNKHAYCIIAHHEPQLLGVLVSLLDDERNDVFLLIDKKATNADFQLLKMSKGRLFVLPQTIKITWSGISQVEAELTVLEYAHSQGDYIYYHLLSGCDLPIKSQNEIHQFFNKFKGQEFILFSSGVENDADLEYKSRYYHINVGLVGGSSFLKRLSKLYVWLQSKLGISRSFSQKLYKGVNWASMTSDFVAYLISHRSNILLEFNGVLCADEIKYINTHY